MGGPGSDNTGRDGVELVEGSLERWVLPEALFLGYRHLHLAPRLEEPFIFVELRGVASVSGTMYTL